MSESLVTALTALGRSMQKAALTVNFNFCKFCLNLLLLIILSGKLLPFFFFIMSLK